MTTTSWDPAAWSEKVQIHAFLMMAAWAFFLPVGLLSQSHLRSSNNWKQRKFGNHCHMSSMTIGVILALAGFVYGIQHLSTFTRNPKYVSPYAMAHAVIGTIATLLMIIGVLLTGMVRTIKPQDGPYEEWPMWRKIGHTSHRSLGFITLTLAFITLEMGTHISSIHGRGVAENLGTKDRQYSIWLLGCYLVSAVVIFGSVRLAKQKYPDDTTSSSSAAASNRITESERIKGDLSELSPLLPH